MKAFDKQRATWLSETGSMAVLAKCRRLQCGARYLTGPMSDIVPRPAHVTARYEWGKLSFDGCSLIWHTFIPDGQAGKAKWAKKGTMWGGWSAGFYLFHTLLRRATYALCPVLSPRIAAYSCRSALLARLELSPWPSLLFVNQIPLKLRMRWDSCQPLHCSPLNQWSRC